MTTFKSRRENQNQDKNLKIRSHNLKDPSLTDHTVGRYIFSMTSVVDYQYGILKIM